MEPAFREADAWATLPLHTQPNCRLDQVIADLMTFNMTSSPDVGTRAEPPPSKFPSISSLLNSEADQAKPLVGSAVVRHTLWIPLSSFVEKLAVAYLLSQLINVSARNMDAIS